MLTINTFDGSFNEIWLFIKIENDVQRTFCVSVRISSWIAFYYWVKINNILSNKCKYHVIRGGVAFSWNWRAISSTTECYNVICVQFCRCSSSCRNVLINFISPFECRMKFALERICALPLEFVLNNALAFRIHNRTLDSLFTEHFCIWLSLYLLRTFSIFEDLRKMQKKINDINITDNHTRHSFHSHFIQDTWLYFLNVVLFKCI